MIKLRGLIDEKFGLPGNAGREFGEKFIRDLIGSGKFAELWTAFEATYPELQPDLQATFEKSNELLRYIKPGMGDETYKVSSIPEAAAQELDNLLQDVLETLEFISSQNEPPNIEMVKSVIKDFDNTFSDMLAIFTSNTDSDKPLEPYKQTDIGFGINESLDEYYVDAMSEDEDYCPSCANKLKESVKKSVNELMEKEKPGLWANIRAKRAKVGKKGMAKKGSKAFKSAKKAGDKINKGVDEISSWDGSASKNPGMWDGKPSEKNTGKPFPTVGEDKLSEKKGKCKPSKGKRFAKRVSGKCRSFGQKGKAKKGGDRIRPGTAKGNAYCARSAKIKKCKNPPCANALSRKKWKCQGSRSVK